MGSRTDSRAKTAVASLLTLAGVVLLLAMAASMLPSSYALVGSAACFVGAGLVWWSIPR